MFGSKSVRKHEVWGLIAVVAETTAAFVLAFILD